MFWFSLFIAKSMLWGVSPHLFLIKLSGSNIWVLTPDTYLWRYALFESKCANRKETMTLFQYCFFKICNFWITFIINKGAFYFLVAKHFHFRVIRFLPYKASWMFYSWAFANIYFYWFWYRKRTIFFMFLNSYIKIRVMMAYISSQLVIR